MNHFMIRLWHGTKSGFYMTTSDDQLSGWTEKKPQGTSQSQMWTKKVMVTGGLLPIWSTTAFWILAKPLYLRSMLRKSMKHTENYNTCSRHWSTERARFFSMKHPTTHHTTNTSKVERIGLQSFASSTIFTWPLTNWPALLQASWQLFFFLDNFLQGKCFHRSRRQKMLSKNLSNPEAWIFMLQE